MDTLGSIPEFDQKAIIQRWKDGFDASQEAFEQAVYSHFTSFVPLVFGVKLESEKEERRARKFLFYPLEEFMCQGDPGKIFQQLSHAEEPSQLCGHNFKNGEPTYSCRDCAYDPTCVLCITCFQKSSHRNHRYRMNTSGGGGYCDCGDTEAWKSDPYCLLHLPRREETESDSGINMPGDMRSYVERTFVCMLKFVSTLLTWEDNDNLPLGLETVVSWAATQPYQCMLYNDEVHTYDQVINTLVRAVDCSKRQALDFATIVDREGRSCVKTGNEEDCNYVKTTIQRNTSRFNTKPLKVEVMRKELVAHQQFALKVLSWLQTVSNKAGSIRRLLCQVLMEPENCRDPTSVSVLETFIRADTTLWKVARVQSHQLLMSWTLLGFSHNLLSGGGVLIYLKGGCCLFDFTSDKCPERPSLKETVFCDIHQANQWYSFMLREFSEDDHDHDVSMPSLSVQIFTVPSLCVSRLYEDFIQDDHSRTFSITRFSLQIYGTPSLARMLIAEHDLLSVIVKAFLAACQPKIRDGKISFDGSDRNNVFKRSMYVLHDLKYALVCKPTCPEEWSDALRENFLRGLTTFLQLLTLIQGIDSIKRQVGQHLDFDPEWKGAFTIQIRLEDILVLFCDWCAADRYLLVEGYKATMEALTACREAKPREVITVGPYTGEVIKHDVASDPISIHHPLNRFLTALHLHLERFGLTFHSPELQNLTLGEMAQSVDVPMSLEPLDIKELMEPALCIQVLLAQTQAGMWRRNGYSLQNQVFFYSNLRCRQEMYDRDISMLQMAASLLPGNELLLQMLNKFGLVNWARIEYDIPGGQEDSVRQTVTLAEEFLSLIIILMGERYIPGVGQVDKNETVKREVIHLLCISPMAHSRITKSLNEDINHETGLDGVLEDIATFKKPQGGGNGKFELKSQYYKEYSPYFYHYYKAEQAKSEEVQRQRKKQNEEDLGLPPPVPPPFSQHFKDAIHLLDCDVMIHVLTAVLTRTAAPRSRSWSEAQFDRVLYIIGMALNEQFRATQNGDPSFTFLQKAIKVNTENAALGQESILGLLQSLVSSRNVSPMQESKDLLAWVLRKFAEALELSDEPVAKEHVESIAKCTDLRSGEETKKKAQAAAKRRKKIMAQMAKMQRDFIAENSELFENTSTEAEQITEVEMAEAPMCGEGQAIALGPHQSPAKISGPIQVTCILCQEEQRISSSGRAMVLSAFVQQSTVLSQNRQKEPINGETCDPLFTSADLQKGTHTSSCGHVMHHECWQGFFSNIVNRERRRPMRFRSSYSYDIDRMEYLCPLCEGLSNTVIPIVPPLPSLVNESSNSPELGFDDWLDGILKTVVNSIKKEEDKESKDELLLFQPCPISTITRMMAESVAKNFQLLWEYVYDESSGSFSEGMREMIKKFARDVYSFGLGVEPDDENSRVSIMAWNTCAYTILATEQELQRDNLAVFEGATERQSALIGALVRFAAVTSQVMSSDVIKQHCVRLLSALIPGELEQRQGQASVCLLDIDLFHLLVVLTMTLPSLHANDEAPDGGPSPATPSSSSSSSSLHLPTGGLQDQHALQLVFTAHLVHILLTYDSPCEDAEVLESTAEGYELLDVYKSLREHAQVVDSALPCPTTLLLHVKNACLPFLRCCCILYHHLTGVMYPAELTCKNSHELRHLLRYLALPAHLPDLFTKQGPTTAALIKSWCSSVSLRERLSASSVALVHHPLRLNQLIDLPQDYSLLINEASTFTCPKSDGDDSRAPTRCLVCGRMLCSQSYCCLAELEGTQVGAATEHAYQCGAHSGIFLRVRECQVLLLSNRTRGCFLPAPYLDMYGETDQGLRRGNPLMLSGESYQNVQKIWYQHNIPQTISRSLNWEPGTTFMIEWHNL